MRLLSRKTVDTRIVSGNKSNHRTHNNGLDTTVEDSTDQPPVPVNPYKRAYELLMSEATHALQQSSQRTRPHTSKLRNKMMH